MWILLENHDIDKVYKKLPLQVKKSYEYWKSLISVNGPKILLTFPGFHDEKLIGKRKGQRSSRLNKLYRVIYMVKEEEITILIIEITPHKY